MRFRLKSLVTGACALSLLGLLAAPFGVSAQAGMKTYEVTITNITTSKQGLSPALIATHPASARAWQMGQPASAGLELLAEEGKPDAWAAELRGGATDVVTTKAHLLPGDSITVMIKARDGDVLSAGTMLIQTNDGFTGLDSVAITPGDKDAMAYDAGTEENTEAAADVPGPPFGGMNRGPATNPQQPIAAHPGIKGTADVTPDFNWSGPVARFTIQRVEVAQQAAPTAVTAAPTAAALPATGPGAAPVPAPAEVPSMPKTGYPAQQEGGDGMMQGDAMKSDLPRTGSGDNLWYLLVAAAGALALSGLALRRTGLEKK